MPTYPVTMPDGTQVPITVDDPSQLGAATMALQKHRTGTAPARDVMSAVGSVPDGGQPGGVGTELVGSALSGLTRGVAGVLQTGTDLYGATGLPGSDWARRESSELARSQAGIEKGLPQIPGVGGELVRGATEMAPSMFAGGPVMQGAFGGGTQLREGESDHPLTDRLMQAGIGSLFGKAFGFGSDKLGKLFAAKGVDNIIKEVKSLYSEVSPAKAPIRKELNEDVARYMGTHSWITKQELAAGDRLGGLDVSGLKDTADRLVGDVGKAAGPDAAGVKLLKNTQRILGQDVKGPDTLQVGGRAFKYDPASAKYVNPQTGDALPDSVVKAAMPPDAGPPNIKYSDLRATRDDLDEYLEKNADRKSNSGVKAVAEMRAAVDARIKELQTPEMRDFEKRADNFYKRYLGKYDESTPGGKMVRQIMGEQDDLTRANLILEKVVKGKDSGIAKDVAGLLDEGGKRAVSEAVVHDALVAATDKTGKLDPVKFLKHFDSVPGFEPFKMKNFDDIAKGLKSYISADALLAGESKRAGLSRLGRHGMTGLAGLGLGLGIVRDVTTGNYGGAVAKVAGVMAPEAATWAVNKLMRDSFARHMLIVLGKLPEGSPRWQRVVQQIATRFKGPAAAGTGTAIGQNTGAAGPPTTIDVTPSTSGQLLR